MKNYSQRFVYLGFVGASGKCYIFQCFENKQNSNPSVYSGQQCKYKTCNLEK